MFATYSIEDFVGQKLKTSGILIHQLENLDFLPPESIKSPHKHLFYELFLVKEGRAIHNVDFTTYEINNNHLFVINHEQVHHWEKNISDELKGYRILFTKKFLHNNFIPSNLLFELMYLYQIQYNPLIPISHNNQLFTYAQLLLTEYLSDPVSVTKLEALLFLFLAEIKNIVCSEKSELKEYTINQINNYQLFLREVESNYHQNLSLKDYAAKVNISTRQLSRMVLEISDTTLNNVIINRRILQSKRLLKYSNLTISEITYAVGFNHTSYFIKIFKRYTGMTPLEFKKGLDL